MDKSIHSEKYIIAITILKEARIAAGITQVQLAEALDETQTFISKCERSERRLDIIEIRTFCTAIGISFIDYVDKLEKEFQKIN